MKDVVEAQGVDRVVVVVLGQEATKHGYDEAGDASASFEEGVLPLPAETLGLLGAVVVIEEGGELIEGQPGELLAHDDAAPQRGDGLDPVAKGRHADEQDSHKAIAGELTFGKGPGFQKGFIG